MEEKKVLGTYDYSNGKVERNFKFVEHGFKCRLSGLPAYAGTSDRCIGCPHNAGNLYSWSFNTGFTHIDKDYVMCKHPDAKEIRDCSKAQQLFYERMQYEAMCATCY